MNMPTDAQQLVVQQAARALARANLVHAYGHCSQRLDEDHFLVCAALPMGLITHEPGTVVHVKGPLPEGMALSTLSLVPRPRHGIGAYFAPGPKFWNDPRLLRDDESATRLAKELDSANAIIMRGNGAIVVADTLEKAVTLSWFLEDAARVERDARMMGGADAGLLNDDEIHGRQVFSGGVVERMWAHLTR
jgi:HCOMODA/2-hydroxy-3-carboxy-muconic semialdehyde decarboxylase